MRECLHDRNPDQPAICGRVPVHRPAQRRGLRCLHRRPGSAAGAVSAHCRAERSQRHAGRVAGGDRAIGKDLRYAASKLGEFGRFARAAIVTDKRWLVTVTEFAAHLMLNTQVRTFAQDERVLALAWAAELDPHTPAP
ncbi:STAS/SEC14 domain-containing protein [Pseudoxanthomonas mexicana]|uniref:STAS/SEC14 domain-containing protein n=1 Tax=Pseudoxanthomonas mexicana TaxID=128785 RepID=A0A7G9THF9_PSEMX|nr:STAS/SEC14 domain-containing protein [Pseudoxanthomonas mexicana]